MVQRVAILINGRRSELVKTTNTTRRWRGRGAWNNYISAYYYDAKYIINVSINHVEAVDTDGKESSRSVSVLAVLSAVVMRVSHGRLCAFCNSLNMSPEPPMTRREKLKPRLHDQQSTTCWFTMCSVAFLKRH